MRSGDEHGLGYLRCDPSFFLLSMVDRMLLMGMERKPRAVVVTGQAICEKMGKEERHVKLGAGGYSGQWYNMGSGMSFVHQWHLRRKHISRRSVDRWMEESMKRRYHDFALSMFFPILTPPFTSSEAFSWLLLALLWMARISTSLVLVIETGPESRETS